MLNTAERNVHDRSRPIGAGTENRDGVPLVVNMESKGVRMGVSEA